MAAESEMLSLRRAAWRAAGVGEIAAGAGMAFPLAVYVVAEARAAFDRAELTGHTVVIAAAAVAGALFVAALAMLHGRDLMQGTPRRGASAVVCLLAASVAIHGAVGAAPAPELLYLSAREQQAFNFLSRTTTFELPFVGIAGVPSGGFVAFRVLSHSRVAGAAFARLFEIATPAGRLYAMCGMYRTDSAAFDSAVAVEAVRGGDVSTFGGCVMQRERYGDVVRLDSRAIRLRRGETLEQWFSRNEYRGERDDIAGGGYPEMLWEAPDNDEVRAAVRSRELAAPPFDP